MTEPLSGARFQREVGADPDKWAAAFLAAYAQADGVRTDADRQAFVAGWFATAMDAAMRVVETDQLRALIGWSLKGQADDMSFAEVVEIAKRRLAEHDAVKAAHAGTQQPSQ
jgi:hypothetical protein